MTGCSSARWLPIIYKTSVSACAIYVRRKLIDRGPRRHIETAESFAPCAIPGSLRHSNRTEPGSPRIEDGDRIAVGSPDVAFLVGLEAIGPGFREQAAVLQRAVSGNVVHANAGSTSVRHVQFLLVRRQRNAMSHPAFAGSGMDFALAVD